MSAMTIASPAAMTGKVRRVDDPRPRWQVQVRQILPSGAELLTRSFPYWELDAAQADFDSQLRLNSRAYSSGRYRLVLIDTEGQR